MGAAVFLLPQLFWLDRLVLTGKYGLASRPARDEPIFAILQQDTIFAMTSCKHAKLELLPERKNRLRCRHCHLTIEADELGDGYCPECFETGGKRRDDFEEIEALGKGSARYSCEECGLIVEND